MIQVKICGITNTKDALCAAECGAAAAGFIFYPASPRYIKPEKVRSIVKILPQNLVKVGVFVNAAAEEVKRIFNYCALDMVQFHGDESPDYCRQFPAGQVIKALELKKEEDLKTAAGYDIAAILVDNRHAGLYGGTGRKANWDLASRILQPLILSGGLNEDNVGEALQMVKPAALDINSGVEMKPGKKDSGKLVRIMEMIKARTLDKKTTIFVQREKS
jgi:phosphoribosylanthranilate isomerase